MRLFKLAARSVLSWRRSVMPAVAAVAVVAGIVTIAGSAVQPITESVAESVRISRGEMAAEMSAGEADVMLRAIGEEQDTRRGGAGATLISVARIEAGALDSVADLLMTRVVRTDVVRELAFRDLEQVEVTAGDAVLLASGETAARMEGRISRLYTRDAGELVRVVRVIAAHGRDASAYGRGPELFVHDPAAVAVAGDAEPRSQPPDGGRERASAQPGYLVRVRGAARPIDEAAARTLEAVGLSRTAWREAADELVRDAWASAAILIAVLSALAVGTLIPGQLLLVRRAKPSIELLSTWGFSRRAIGGLVLLMGAFSAAVAAAAGGAVGVGVATVMNTRGRPAAELLPMELAEQLRGLATTVVTPAVGWAAAAVAIATLLGGLTALPSAVLCGRMVFRRGLWHW